MGSFIRRFAGVFLGILLCWSTMAWGQGAARTATSRPRSRGGRAAAVTTTAPAPAAATAPAATMPAEALPEIQIPAMSLKSGLLEADLTVVDRYIAFWVGKLTNATDENTILEARKRLITGYRKYDSWQYQNVYAGRASKALLPLLEVQEVQKQINAALAISQMRQVTVQPALEVLVVNPNPALRLYGWAGYRGIRMLVLGQGKEAVDVMMKSLAKASLTEDSGAVMGAVLGMMYLDPDRPSMVTPVMFEDARERLFQTFRQAWPRVCTKVLEGDADMTAAAGDGLSALRKMSAGVAAKGEIPQGAVQMIVDLASCASKAYAKAVGNGLPSVSAEALLRDSEDALNAITELRRAPISEALAAKNEAERAAAVDDAVDKWIDFLKNANWPIQEPKFQASAGAATSQPAPAAAPAPTSTP